MKTFRRSTQWLCLAVLVPVVGVWVCRLHADEIDNALNVEKMADTEEVLNVEPLTTEDMKQPDAFRGLELQLQEKELELQEARREIKRLNDMIAKIRESNDKEMATMLYNMGCLYKANHMYDRAEDAFVRAVKIMPRDPAIHYNLAILYDDDLNDKAKAREHYQTFLKLAPDDKDAPRVVEWLASLKPVPSGL